ncbi:MAG: lipopolysaccharide biosynthesis protein [Candidatus Rokubacteria bacterium]|nr:lipopolysaccharide biosynthesis protein [Candidatus Rokubacteria bacterium]
MTGPRSSLNPTGTESTFAPTLVLTTGRIVAFAATFFIPVVLARVFDQAGFGTYKQLFLVYATLFYIAQLGMAESLFYFLPLEPRAAGRYVANALLSLAVSGLACLVLLAALAPTLSAWLNNAGLARHLPLIGILLALMLASVPLEMVMTARKQYPGAAATYALSDLLRAACFVVPALLAPRLEWVLYGGLAFAALRLLAALGYVGVAFGGVLRTDRALLRKQLGYAFPFGLAAVVAIVQSNLDQYVVAARFDAATFAIYAVGCLQIPLVDFLTTSAGNVLMVRMSEAIRDGRHEVVPGLWRDATRTLAFVLFPLVGLLVATAPELIGLLFTESYAASVPLFMLSSTAILLSAPMTDAVLRVYAETRFLLVQYAVRLAVLAALIPWLLQALGLIGAVLASLLAAVVAKGLALARVPRLIRVAPAALVPWSSLAAIAAVAAAAGVVARLVAAELTWPALPRLLTMGAVYAGAYGALGLAAGLLDGEERAALRRWWARLGARAAKAEGA